jgi:hypothetical protein
MNLGDHIYKNIKFQTLINNIENKDENKIYFLKFFKKINYTLFSKKDPVMDNSIGKLIFIQLNSYITKI